MGSAGRILGTIVDHPTVFDTPIYIVQFGAVQTAAFGGAETGSFGRMHLQPGRAPPMLR